MSRREDARVLWKKSSLIEISTSGMDEIRSASRKGIALPWVHIIQYRKIPTTEIKPPIRGTSPTCTRWTPWYFFNPNFVSKVGQKIIVKIYIHIIKIIDINKLHCLNSVRKRSVMIHSLINDELWLVFIGEKLNGLVVLNRLNIIKTTVTHR